MESRIDNVVPELVGEPLLDVLQGPTLLPANILQLRLEERDLVLVCGILQILLDGFATHLQVLPEDQGLVMCHKRGV